MSSPASGLPKRRKKPPVTAKHRLWPLPRTRPSSYIPELDPSTFTKEADYFHICMNNTIYGTKYHTLPETGEVPLVADISSCILSEPIDVSKFGVLYAGAQKNMGPAGLTVVIIREDLIGHAQGYHAHHVQLSDPCGQRLHVQHAALLFDLHLQAGARMAEKRHRRPGGDEEASMRKGGILYDFLDSSKLFHGTVVKKDRSLMNVPFVTGNEELDAKFVKEAAAAGFVNLKGHRSVGGMRASIYNAMPIEGVEKLVEFMKEFEEENA